MGKPLHLAESNAMRKGRRRARTLRVSGAICRSPSVRLLSRPGRGPDSHPIRCRAVRKSKVASRPECQVAERPPAATSSPYSRSGEGQKAPSADSCGTGLGSLRQAACCCCRASSAPGQIAHTGFSLLLTSAALTGWRNESRGRRRLAGRISRDETAARRGSGVC
jgi:hypothetical protein